MKTTLILLFLTICLFMKAQHPGGGFSGKSYVLHGETEIILKDGSKVTCKDRINGVDIGKTNIDYKNVDHIRLIKTSLKGFERANGSIYKFIRFKNKPQLVRVLEETPRLSFYVERPKMTGGGYNAIGQFQPHGVSARKIFMVKSGSDEAQIFDTGKNGKNIPILFPECPRLKQYQADNELRKMLSLLGIAYIYNNSNCEEANLKDIEKDKEGIDAYIKSIEE